MKNVIVAKWVKTGEMEVFSSLKGFLENYPDFNEHTITNYLTRKRQPYITDTLQLSRLPFIGRKVY